MMNDEQSDLAVMYASLLDTFGASERFTADNAWKFGCVEAKGPQGVGVVLSSHVDGIAGGVVLRKHKVLHAADEYSVHEVGP
jgi:hypothetical protein